MTPGPAGHCDMGGRGPLQSGAITSAPPPSPAGDALELPGAEAEDKVRAGGRGYRGSLSLLPATSSRRA